MLSHLKLSVLYESVHIRFEDWGISLVSDILRYPPVLAVGNIWSHDVFQPTVGYRKYLMDHDV